jgi:hypothetical protein
METRNRSAKEKPHRICYEEFRHTALANPCCGQTVGGMAEHLFQLARREVKGTAPAAAFEALLDQVQELPVHGFWHHALPGEILLLCLQQAGYPIAEELIEEIIERGRLSPPGTCGFLGPCGALVSAAAAYAMLLGSTPAAADRRERLLRFHARLAARLAELGGSRCCKKSSYTALDLAREEFANLGFGLPHEEFAGRCRFCADNETCDGAECVYFPGKG